MTWPQKVSTEDGWTHTDDVTRVMFTRIIGGQRKRESTSLRENDKWDSYINGSHEIG